MFEILGQVAHGCAQSPLPLMYAELRHLPETSCLGLLGCREYSAYRMLDLRVDKGRTQE